MRCCIVLDAEVLLLQVHELIVDNAVIHDLKAQSKTEAIQEIISALQTAKRLSEPAKVVADLSARERAGATGVINGVALLHVCTSGVHQPVLAFGRTQAPMDFGAVDGEQANIVFLLLGPAAGENLHLKFIARITHLLSSADFQSGLLTVTSPQSLRSLLQRSEAEIGEIQTPEELPSICVAGAGNGGMAMAAHLSLLGCRVNIFNRSKERIQLIQCNNGIHVSGKIEGFAKINVITTDVGEALAKTDIVMIVIPATGHRDMARLLAPHFTDGQIIILNPGRTGGVLEFVQTLRQIKVFTQLFIAEAQSLIYAARVVDPGQVHIFEIKNSVPIATLPAYHIPDILAVVRKVFPQFIPGDDVLKTSLNNIGSVFHPALAILNSAWIEDAHGEFEFYHQGASRAVARILEELDAERVAVAAALGVQAMTAKEWLYSAYGATGDDLYAALQANRAYSGIKAPNRLDHRYITEDVPMSLVPLAALGDQLKIPVPTINAFIHIASVLHNRDYRAEGRTIDRLGLEGLTVQQIRLLVVKGEVE